MREKNRTYSKAGQRAGRRISRGKPLGKSRQGRTVWGGQEKKNAQQHKLCNKIISQITFVRRARVNGTGVKRPRGREPNSRVIEVGRG